MGNEMSKAMFRRREDWRYNNRWIMGRILDIGCGTDPYPGAIGYDKELGDKDAQLLPEIEEDVFDTIVSSHCLEHMKDPTIAFTNWLRVLKPGGYIVFTVPDWTLYEHHIWPSKFNVHYKAWTLEKGHVGEHIIYLPTWLQQFKVDIEMLQLLTEHFDYSKPREFDQTGSPAECAIECVVRKL